MMARTIHFIALFLFPLLANAQDIEKTIDELKDRWQNDPVTIHGQLHVQGTANQIQGMNRRLDPFSFQVRAHAALDLLGIKAPFQFTYSDGNTLYRLPSFLVTGISPHYRNFTVHAGDRSMQFSDYSLAGHGFRGVGIEYQNQNSGWYAASFYGRLRRAFAGDLDSKQAIEPSFKRMGYGIKSGFRKNGNEITISLLQVRDQENVSVQSRQPNLTPSSNFVVDLQMKKQLGAKWDLQGEIARSLLNRNIQATTISSTWWDQGFGLFTPTLSMEKHLAWKGSFSYRIHPKHQIHFYTEHIDPGYRSLGALFFQNDFERIGLRTQHQLVSDKIQLQTDLGSERNNLKGFESNQLRRLRGSLNIQWFITPQWQSSGNYSNIRQTNKLFTYNNPSIPVDSLVLAITNQQAQLQTLYRSPSGVNTIQFLLQFQDLQQIMDEQISNQSNANWLGSIQYSKKMENEQATLSFYLTWNKNQFNDTGLNSWSTGSIWNHRIKKWTYAVAFMPSLMQTVNQGKSILWAGRGQCKYQWTKNQQLLFSYRYLNRSGGSQNTLPAFIENTTQIQYQYQF